MSALTQEIGNLMDVLLCCIPEVKVEVSHEHDFRFAHALGFLDEIKCLYNLRGSVHGPILFDFRDTAQLDALGIFPYLPIPFPTPLDPCFQLHI